MKFAIYGGLSVGGLLGSYLPVLIWNANPFGLESILLGFIGSMVGLVVGYSLGKHFDL